MFIKGHAAIFLELTEIFILSNFSYSKTVVHRFPRIKLSSDDTLVSVDAATFCGHIMELVENKIAELRWQQSKIVNDLKELEIIAAKRQRRNYNEVEEAIFLLKSKFIGLRQVLDHFDKLGKNPEFWKAFLESKNEIPRFKDFHNTVYAYARQIQELLYASGSITTISLGCSRTMTMKKISGSMHSELFRRNSNLTMFLSK